MTLGEYIKDLRAKLQLSQPQLAEQIGIEQSYLSKLENDKSLPSNEVFRRMLSAFNLSLPAFTAAFSAQDLQQLVAITDVELYVKQQQSKQQGYSSRLIVSLSFTFALGAACFYAGIQALCFPEKLHQYESQGVVLPGESAFVFKDWEQNYPMLNGSSELIRQAMQDRAEKAQLMYQRLAQLTEQSFEQKGQYYIRTVDGGSRTFEYKNASWVNRTGNTVLQLLGLFMMAFSCAFSIWRRVLLKH